MAPQPVPNWTGVRDAVRWGDQSPQGEVSRIPIFKWLDQLEPFSENCCVLNVHTP